jgi:DNA-binding NtrC family response regulator
MSAAAAVPVPVPVAPPAAGKAVGAGRVLVAEDDAALRELLVELLTESGYDVVASPNGADALARLRGATPPEVVLTDLMMPGLGGEAVLRAVGDAHPGLPVVVMTAFGSIDSAVRLVRAGAFDYVTKPVGTAELLASLARAVAESRARRGGAASKAVPAGGTAGAPATATVGAAGAAAMAGIVAESAQMRAVLALVERVAPAPHPVLLTGESGTGKEVIARAIHARSGRGPFVAVNCGAVPEPLIEAELFGHEKGAFTGADRDKAGLVEAAHGGTLFLDEIGELPVAVQPALLRVLERGEVRRVGATQARHFDVRIVAATNRDLEDEMRAGRFRDDLYWRLNVLPVELAPLRERPADVRALARRFLDEAGCQWPLEPAAEALLAAYAWPGNVRELRNAMQRAATLATGPVIRAADLPARLREANSAAALVATASAELLPLAAVERAYVLEVLRRTEGNKSRAAEVLGMDRKTLYRKLAEWARETSDGADGGAADVADAAAAGTTDAGGLG